MKNFANNKIVIGVAGAIVGLIIGWLAGLAHIGAGDDHGPATDSRDEVKGAEAEQSLTESTNAPKPLDALLTNNSNALESDSAIMVGDQAAGSMVTVGSVETDDSTWVVVREDNNGVFGNILGASRVDGGDSSNIVIELLRPTVSGKTYRIVLFKDNGDAAFDYRSDMPLVSQGVAISQPFRAR